MANGRHNEVRPIYRENVGDLNMSHEIAVLAVRVWYPETEGFDEGRRGSRASQIIAMIGGYSGYYCTLVGSSGLHGR